MTPAPPPVIEIEALQFDGMTAEEARRATAAFEEMLGQLIETQGLPGEVEVTEIGEIDLGNLPVSGASPEGLGRELARALFQELAL